MATPEADSVSPPREGAGPSAGVELWPRRAGGSPPGGRLHTADGEEGKRGIGKHEERKGGNALNGHKLPLINARAWSVGFLLIGIGLAVLFSQTLPHLFDLAYHR